MPIYTPGKVTLAKGYSLPDDADAVAYIAQVEAADEIASPGIGALEPATRMAINSFVKGCKADGIWPAIKASCILAGARTLAGALVPLVGAAPTNVGGLFVAGDYNRETGLVGNGSTKYLNSNRNNNVDPQNNLHFSVYATSLQSADSSHMIGSGTKSYIIKTSASNNSSSGAVSYVQAIGFCGTARSSASGYAFRNNGVNINAVSTSLSPDNQTFNIFRRADSASQYSNARLAFYSIGESLDLALLDARVTTLINAFAAAIP